MTEKNAELADFSTKSFHASSTENLQHYDLSGALQITLDFNELIQIFSTKIQSLIPHNSVEYVNIEFGINYQRGVTGRHSCSYDLQIQSRQLGNLKLTRSQRFSKKELGMLENLLCFLIYPLRNATLYHQALQKAYTDPLTQMYNRCAFSDMLLREIKRARRGRQHLALIFVDIDHFKTINDEHGHVCGDLALIAVANRIRENIRGSDLAFRYGGEEFVVLLSSANREEATIIAERIRHDIDSRTIAYGMTVLNITVSLGVSSLNSDDDVESFVNRADLTMYRAKQLGRNQVCID